MANKRNYQKELDSLITDLEKEGKVPRLFLHSCCAPCASYVLEYLSEYFEITVFYYNPNMKPSSFAPRKVRKMPSWAAAPSSRLFGLAISGAKSVIAPTPMKIRGG